MSGIVLKKADLFYGVDKTDYFLVKNFYSFVIFPIITYCKVRGTRMTQIKQIRIHTEAYLPGFFGRDS